MSIALYPALKIGQTEEKIRRSISRLSTGLNILAGGTSGDFLGIKLQAEGVPNKGNFYYQVGMDLLRTAEVALLELAP